MKEIIISKTLTNKIKLLQISNKVPLKRSTKKMIK